MPLELKDVRKRRCGGQGGLLEEVDLQLDLEGFKKEEVISGEEVENTMDFEAQRMRFLSSAIFSFQRRQKNSLHEQNIYFSS